MRVRAVGMRVQFALLGTMPMIVTVRLPIGLRYRMTAWIALMAVVMVVGWRSIGGFRNAALLPHLCRLRRFVIVFIPTPSGMRSKPLY